MTRRHIMAAVAAFVLAMGASLAVAESSLVLDSQRVASAIVTVRSSLPAGWTVDEIHWETTPRGWVGDSTSVMIKVIDESVSIPHPSGQFTYHPFHRIWFLPLGWEGRMEITEYDSESPTAVYLGENGTFRLLHRTLGSNSWPQAPHELAAVLEVAPLPLGHEPRHTLDIGAMQRLFVRLDNSTDDRSSRWQQQVYGIEELPEMVYLELLTWARHESEAEDDPTFLGEIAERGTRYLSQQTLRAFPKKKALYLRRVTENSFSDILVVNRHLLADGH